MILSICLSPCIDVNIEVDTLGIGMSQNIISKHINFTGKAINVAIGLSRLGVESFATGFMYEDNGRLFEQELHKEGVTYRFAWSKGRVRENYKFIDHRSMLTEVNDISPEVDVEKQEELLQLIADIAKNCEAVVLSGGLAKGMSTDFYGKILQKIPKDVLKIVDTEGERMLHSLHCGVDLIKPNLEEAQHILKRIITTKEELINGCKELISMGTKIVLLSLGKKGAVITDGSNSYYCKSNNVAMNSTLGAGDAMVAGATYALAKKLSIVEILKHGVAAGAAAVTQTDTLTFTKDKYDEIYQNLVVEEI